MLTLHPPLPASSFILPDVPPSTPRSNGLQPADSPSSTTLAKYYSHLNSNSSLSQAGAELEAVRATDAELRVELNAHSDAATPHDHELSPSLETFDERLVQLSLRVTALHSAVQQAETTDAEEQFRRSPARSRPGFTSATDVEDVFGPTLHSMPFGDEEQDDFDDGELDQLQEQLHNIHSGLYLDVGVSLQLPTAEEADAVKLRLSFVAKHLDDLEDGGSPEFDLANLRRDLEHKLQQSQRITALSDFRDRIAGADAALSDLLTSIDAATPGLELPPSSRPSTPGGSPSLAMPLSEALLDATRAVTKARKDAVVLVDDKRVVDRTLPIR